MAFEFTDKNFSETALAGGVSVVDFWAEWCGPCRLIGPIVDDLATEYEGRVTVGKVNVDDNPEVAMKYGIRSIPTILIIKDGEVVEKHVGTTTKASLAEKIETHLN
jgi:thioredoxin 1